MNAIAVHLYHDSTVALNPGGEIHNIELERIFAKRNYDWSQQSETLDDVLEALPPGLRKFDVGLVIGGGNESAHALLRKLEVKSVRSVDHHVAHAAAAFYQSPFERSLVISYDGGGNDGTFRTFFASRDGGIQPLDAHWRLNLGIPYRALAHPIEEIRKPEDGRELSNAGKLMGLVAFGETRPEWIEPIRDYYQECNVGGDAAERLYRWVLSHHRKLGLRLGLDLSRNALQGREAFDLAKTAQHVFEQLFLERVLPLVQQHGLPVCVTGGCALNVLTNQRLADRTGMPVFVPPNPNDCGLASGALLWDTKPREAVTLTYSGAPILDIDDLPGAISKFGAIETQPRGIAQLLSEGCIIAVMRGNSEHGPRALGNRSLLCDPGIAGMKERLNSRVKFREGFRPYAPVIRAEDAHKYFENTGHDMSYMSFNPTVRLEWRNALAAACHVDFTARAQTVTARQNPWLYDLLTEFERMSGYGALLNTSFNSKGRPIVTRIFDALEILSDTDIDFLVIENWLFSKADRENAQIAGPGDEIAVRNYDPRRNASN